MWTKPGGGPMSIDAGALPASSLRPQTTATQLPELNLIATNPLHLSKEANSHELVYE